MILNTSVHWSNEVFRRNQNSHRKKQKRNRERKTKKQTWIATGYRFSLALQGCISWLYLFVFQCCLRVPITSVSVVPILKKKCFLTRQHRQCEKGSVISILQLGRRQRWSLTVLSSHRMSLGEPEIEPRYVALVLLSLKTVFSQSRRKCIYLIYSCQYFSCGYYLEHLWFF